METQFIQVVTTTENKQDAEKIARALVEKRLAGCAQIIGPIKSIYWWKEQVETTKEWLCIVKTKRRLFEEIQESIREIHPYETPEILAMPITKGSEDYLNWLDREVKKG